MKNLNTLMVAVLALVAASGPVFANVHYVDVNCANPTPPYTSWATAATTIQDAVDAAVDGDQVLVTNGLYQTGCRVAGAETNRLVVDKALSLLSVNGPQFTTLDGGGVFRCLYLTNGASVSGFTLANGATTGSGGGVWCASKAGAVSNCVLTGNSAQSGGGAYRGTLTRCMIIGNSAADAGGVRNAVLIGCIVVSNSALMYGGGVVGNGLAQATLTNCLVIGNSAKYGGGAYGELGGNGCILVHCTVVGNSATGDLNGATGDFGGGGADRCQLINSIIYYNKGAAPNNDNVHRSIANYSCISPGPQIGTGYVTNVPLFINFTGGNFHLQPDSPCIDSGLNLGGVVNDFDGRLRSLDGNADGTAESDMGAYEHAVFFVRQDNASPTPPYNSWVTAATNIQDAADLTLSAAGDQILVTNGVYQYGGRADGRVVLNNALTTIQSVNGPQFSLIKGGSSVRCVYLANGTFMSGFTLTNGSAFSGGGVGFGGGLGLESDAVVSNCVLVGNSALSAGGAGSVLVTGGYLPMGGSLINCVLSNNSATAFQPGNPTLGIGGGADNCKLDGCTLVGNYAAYGGGGASASRLSNCRVTDNSAQAEGGGTRGSWLYNCLMDGNSSGTGAAYFSTLVNCTLTANPAGGAYSGFLTNCIVYDNGGGWNHIGATLNYCCTTPLPGSGIGNFTNAPLFVDPINGNLRLQSNSPCINAGDNAAAPSGNDLDGRPRTVSGAVDIGAYEYQPGASGEFIGWLSLFNLPTDGSADYSDSDSDLLNNWQEWIAGTIPTDASSALRLLNPSSSTVGAVVTWQSVTNRTYFLQRATNLGVAPIFSLVSNNFVGQAGTTSFTDTNAIGPGPFFYRVGVQ